MMHFRSLTVAAAICGVTRADGSGMTPIPGGKIYSTVFT